MLYYCSQISVRGYNSIGVLPLIHANDLSSVRTVEIRRGNTYIGIGNDHGLDAGVDDQALTDRTAVRILDKCLTEHIIPIQVEGSMMHQAEWCGEDGILFSVYGYTSICIVGTTLLVAL